jgi:hypothetical protein
MSKFKDEIAEKMFLYLDKNLSSEVKAVLTPTLITELIYHSADFVVAQRLNDIFDSAIILHKAILKWKAEEDSEEEDESFISLLKKV